MNQSRARVRPFHSAVRQFVDTPSTTGVVMMICPNLKCRKVLRVPENCRGKQVKCHFCGINFQVPLPKRDSTPQRPAADE